jgi:hypothetical protein
MQDYFKIHLEIKRRIMLKRVLFISLFLGACGSNKGNDTDNNQTPANCTTAWAIAKNVVHKNCTSCHDGTKHSALLPQAMFDASPVRSQVSSGKMPPPPAILSAGDSASLNAYLTCSGK